MGMADEINPAATKNCPRYFIKFASARLKTNTRLNHHSIRFGLQPAGIDLRIKSGGIIEVGVSVHKVSFNFYVPVFIQVGS
jgi:hypothetical protein